VVTSRLPYRAGLLFGGLAFLAGALLGPVRELALAPRLGGLAAAWIEAAAMAFLLWLAARATVQPGASLRDRALIAALALTVVLLAEAALSWIFAASGLAAARAPRGAAEQLPGLLLLLWLVALPFLRRRT
jgi:hypothetical protein